MYPFSCVLWAIFLSFSLLTASKCKYVNYYDCHPPVIAASLYCSVPTSFIFGRIVRIHTETSAGRHIAYDTHVCSVQLKIEDFCVLNDTFLFGRLVLVVQNSPVPQWPPCFKDDTMFLAKFHGRGRVKARMHFYLIDQLGRLLTHSPKTKQFF